MAREPKRARLLRAPPGETARSTDPGAGAGARLPLVRQLRVRNYKGLADVSVGLRSPFVLVVGRNASGKSSLLDAFHLLAQMLVKQRDENSFGHGRPGVVFRNGSPVEDLVTRPGTGPIDLAMATASHAFWLTARLGTAPPFDLGFGPPDALDLAKRTSDGCVHLEKPGESGRDQKFFANPEMQGFAAAALLRILAAAVGQPSFAQAGEPRLSDTGAGVPSFLAWLAGNEPEKRERIEADLARIVPGTGRLRTPREERTRTETELLQVGENLVPRQVQRQVTVDALTIEFKGVGAVRAEQVSEGTLVSLALLTQLHAPSCPRVVLLDDIDRGLHPLAQRELVDCVRRVLGARKDTQVVATTHSPYLVDLFELDHVVVLRADPLGRIKARLLSEHPDAVKWKNTLRTGEFWSAVGDDWVLGTP